MFNLPSSVMQTQTISQPGRREGSKNREKDDPLYRKGVYGYEKKKKAVYNVNDASKKACAISNKKRSEQAFEEGYSSLIRLIATFRLKHHHLDLNWKIRKRDAQANKVAKFLENQIRRERRGILTDEQRLRLISLPFFFSGEKFEVSLKTRGFPRED